MKQIELAKGIYWVGAIDWSIRDFHGYSTNRGTTYNAYLIVDDKVTLIDTVKEKFRGEMMHRIHNIIDPKKIDYIVVNHVEMDHSGGLPATIAAVQPEKIICGGPMMGMALFGTDIPVTKTSTALLAFSKDAVSAMEPGPCINCGRCLEVCPGRVMPSRLADAAEHFDEETFLELNGMECCECGCCSYVCPAKRPLTQEIKSMRKLQLAKRKR